ncbi:MAG TPA: pyrroline-5-carboxylate reductase [Acidimicrobiales bacterium]|nr:pyrroline-5-carboxylate reductase [Acidimicrobiales bacterium]
MAFTLIIVGGGRMGSALAGGLLKAKWCKASELALIESSPDQRAAVEARLPGVSVRGAIDPHDVNAGTGAVLCVKPEQAENAARAVGISGVTRMLSVVAGMSTARLEAVFPGPVAVIRSMPNTPVLVGKGASAIAGGSNVTSEDLDWAQSILGAVGIVVRVTERHLDVVTGLSGSMPAYLYLVIEALIEAGVHQGLSRDVSRQLVAATFEGSAALLRETGESPEELRAQVTSPGGTTAAGLRVLENRAVRAAFLDAVAAAAERSRQLGR